MERKSGAALRGLTLRKHKDCIMNLARLILIFSSLCLFSPPAAAQVAIEKPWARATAPGARARRYMVIRNQGAAGDRLPSASSPAEGRASRVNDNGDEDARARMTPAKGG
jgi:copper(I)-binding protein